MSFAWHTNWDGDELARPDLPRPSCRVMLVCGPPAAGKSTYVQAHAGPDDVVIDLDLIAREHGYGRQRPSHAVAGLLADRNARLAALADEPPSRLAWVILTAPSSSLRRWWCETLGVRPLDLVLLVPPFDELLRRIVADPDRMAVRQQHYQLVKQWFARERVNDPGMLKRGWDENGKPTDPLHSWNN